MDLGLGADVDSLRRLVEDDDARPKRQPLAEHDLLLIAAAERRDRRLRSTRALTASAVVIARAALRLAGAHDQPKRAYEASAGSVMFSRTFIAAITPRRRRSSGTRQMPCRMASRGECDRKRLAVEQRRVRPGARRRRKSPRPARSGPRRSGRRCRGLRRVDGQRDLDVGIAARSAAARSAAPRVPIAVPPVALGARLDRAPDHQLHQPIVRDRLACSVPALRPSRSTTARSASVSISFRRCEM